MHTFKCTSFCVELVVNRLYSAGRIIIGLEEIVWLRFLGRNSSTLLGRSLDIKEIFNVTYRVYFVIILLDNIKIAC